MENKKNYAEMTDYELFKLVYGDGDNSIMPIGARVSEKSVHEKLCDRDLDQEVISRLFEECPSKFPGERKDEKHYILKRKWSILNEYNLTKHFCKVYPKDKWRYIKWFILDTLFVNSDRRWYLEPNLISRHGRFFLNKRINF